MYKNEVYQLFNMNIFKIKIKSNFIKEYLLEDDWMFVHESPDSFKNNWDVIIPEDAGFIYNKQSVDFINSLNNNILIDFISSDYPIAIDNYNDLIDTFNKKNIRVISPNLLLFGKKNHYFYDPKIRQQDFVLERAQFFDECCLQLSKFLRPFKYLYLTSHPRFERIQILDFLFNNNLEKEGQIGFPSIEKITEEEFDLCLGHHSNEDKEYVKSIKDKNYNLPLIADFYRNGEYSLNKKHKLWTSHGWVESNLENGDFNFNLYSNSYLEIFSETYFYGFGSVDNFLKNTKNQYIQVSEKTIKPIINLLPFYCLTEAGYYRKLKEMGLTFDSEIYKYLDFDELNTGKSKVEKFNSSIYNILSHSKNEIHEMYYNSYEELVSNKYIFKNTLSKELNRCFR